MKNAIILHGKGDGPDLFWFPYAKNGLMKMGYDVWLPELPNAINPNYNEWLPFVLKEGKFSNETILIGHSMGCSLIMHILENINVTIRQAILVSGYAESLPASATDKSKRDLNWEKIKQRAQNFIFINSDNDPWECTDVQGRIFFDHLGGMQIILHEGHMGSTTHNQPYKDFPLLLKLVS